MGIRIVRAAQALTCSLAIVALNSLALAAPMPTRSFPDPVDSTSLSPYPKHVLSLGPVGYWRLGEPRGTTAFDWSKDKRNGVYHGSPTLHEFGAIKEDSDRAVGLSAKSFVQIPSSGDFSLKHGLTVEAWMRPDPLDFPGQSKDPYVHWLGKGEKGRFEWGFRFYSRTRPDGSASARPNRISAYIWNAAGGEGAGAYFQETVTKGQWIHVVAVYEPPGPSAGVRIYRDGVFKKGPPDKGTLYSSYKVVPSPGMAPLRLGTLDLHNFFVGGLDEVAIYPRVLTAEEIRANYRIGANEKVSKGSPLPQKKLAPSGKHLR